MRLVVMQKATSLIEQTSSLNDADIEQVMHIGQANFAANHVTEAYLATYMENPDSFFLLYRQETNIVGFSICTQWTAQKLLAYIEPHAHLIEKEVTADTQTQYGVIKTIAIQPEWQKRGVGSELFIKSELCLQDLGLRNILAPAWIYAGIVNVQVILERNAYQPWFLIEDMWHPYCEDPDFNCPKKPKQGGCICGLFMYRKQLA